MNGHHHPSTDDKELSLLSVSKDTKTLPGDDKRFFFPPLLHVVRRISTS